MTGISVFSAIKAAEKPDGMDSRGIIQMENLKAWYSNCLALKGVNLKISSQAVTAIIGPSGCGKSTLIRCLNRMHEVSSGGRVEGSVYLDGQDIYARDVDPVAL